ncbi:MAG TPA: flagellar biosynthesis anti-sigma factor FlgM [Bryobacteraceae bacterium]|jgi:anti-sigma28 factor (negative regulator of flagellin synthesis)|nr:flagellar biosynthesis anti-sigma factor FlgM [Bryobacteraceae bacterium]
MRLQLDSSSIGTGNVTGTASTEAAGNSRRAGGANVSDTQDTSSVSGISSLLSNLSAERAARVQQLAAQVQGGTYNVPSAAIGHAMVSQAIR